MQRRHDELRGQQVASMMEEMTGREVSQQRRESVTRGADELDLVRSGLDDTMRLAYQEIANTMDSNPNIHDLRTAAYVVSIGKIARSYDDIGVF